MSQKDAPPAESGDYLFVDHTGVERRTTLILLRQWHAEGRVRLDQPVTPERGGPSVTVGELLGLPTDERAIPGASVDYDFFADKIGMVPNARKSDNLYQAKVFGIAWVACVIVGGLYCGLTSPDGFGAGLVNGLLLGGLLGMVVALLVSGVAVGFRGFKR